MLSIPGILRASILLAIIGLTGCGSEYKVTQITGPEVPKYLPEDGIYYSLPKTEIVIRLPVRRIVTNHSMFSYKFDENVEKCQNDRSAEPEAPPREPITEYKRGRIGIFTRAIADPLHRYRLDVTAGPFSEFTHTVKVTEAGVLTNADTTVKDARTAFALSTAKSLVKLLGAATGLRTLRPTVEAAPMVAPSCQNVLDAKRMADAVETDTATQIETLETKREELIFDTGLGSKPETLQKALSHLDGKIAIIKQAAEKRKKRIGVLPKKVDVTELALFGLFAPKEFMPFDSTAGSAVDWRLLALIPKPDQKDQMKALVPPVVSGTAWQTEELAAVEELNDLLQSWNLKVEVKPSVQYASCSAATCPPPMGNGYRYRLAASGEVTVSIRPNLNANAVSLVVVKAEVPVAQYGPIARLPSKFDGLEGNVVLGLYADFGTLKEVTVGAKPQAPDTLSNFTQLVTDTIAARRAAREAKEAEEAGAEKAALTERKDLLQLELDILTLEKKLKELRATEAE